MVFSEKIKHLVNLPLKGKLLEAVLGGNLNTISKASINQPVSWTWSFFFQCCSENTCYITNKGLKKGSKHVTPDPSHSAGSGEVTLTEEL